MTHILVVEDDASARELLDCLLQGQGYSVSTAADGVQAFEQLREEAFDLVLSDVEMQAGSGLELVARVRQLGLCDMPVILMSGRDDCSRRVSGLNLGADDFMAKPIDVEELLARMRAHLRRSARQLQLARDSVLDPLTRVLNRRGLSELFTGHAALQSRRGGSLSALVLDLDGFKLINDRHGHAVGDTVLSHIGQALAETVRASDRVARLGGDEFAILLPDADLEVASKLARRVRTLSPAEVPFGSENALRIGFSVGSATCGAGESLDQLLARADAHMYEEKQARCSL